MKSNKGTPQATHPSIKMLHISDSGAIIYSCGAGYIWKDVNSDQAVSVHIGLVHITLCLQGEAAGPYSFTMEEKDFEV